MRNFETMESKIHVGFLNFVFYLNKGKRLLNLKFNKLHRIFQETGLQWALNQMKSVKSNVINSHLKVFLSGCFPVAMFHLLVLAYDPSFMSVTALILELMKKFVYKAKAYSGPCQAYKMEHFAKIVNGFKLLTIFAKNSILEV